MRGALMTNAIQAAAEIKGDDRTAVIHRATDIAVSLNLTQPAALRLMTSVEGEARLLWLSLRKDHPELTPQRVMDLLADDATKQSLFDGFAAAEKLDQVRDGPVPKAGGGVEPQPDATCTAPSPASSNSAPATPTS